MGAAIGVDDRPVGAVSYRLDGSMKLPDVTPGAAVFIR